MAAFTDLGQHLNMRNCRKVNIIGFASTAVVSLALAICVYGTFGAGVADDFVESLVLRAYKMDKFHGGFLTDVVSIGEVMVVIAVSTTIPPV